MHELCKILTRSCKKLLYGKDDHSIALGTLHCIPCSNSYISLVVPFAFAGLALVAFLLLLNLSVSNGMINGFIFYTNIIQANRSVFFPSKKHSHVLSVFIAWMNLDLGIETCFYDGMTILLCLYLASIPLSILCLVSDSTDHCSKSLLRQSCKQPWKQSSGNSCHTSSCVILKDSP